MRKPIRRATAASALLASAALAATAFTPASAATDSNPYNLVNPKHLTVCDASSAPAGAPGPEQMLSNYLSSKLVPGHENDTANFPVKTVKVSKQNLRSGTAMHKCDIGVGSLGTNDPANADMTLSAPYLENSLVLMTNKGSGISSIKKAKGKSVAVQKGTAGAEYAKKHRLKTVTYPTAKKTLASLHQGKTDAALGDYTALGSTIQKNYLDSETTPTMKTVQQINTQRTRSVAIHKNNDALANRVNKVLTRKSLSSAPLFFDFAYWYYADSGQGPTSANVVQ